MFPSGENGERLPSYRVAIGCDIDGTPEARAAALADLQNFMTPPSKRQVEAWLVELSMLVARRAVSEVEDTLRLEAYSSRLVAYPADVVKEVLHNGSWKFWPAWSELQTKCEALTTPRKSMINALSRPIEEPEEERREPTREERDRIQSLVDAMFPEQAQEDRKAAVDLALQGDCMKGPIQ